MSTPIANQQRHFFEYVIGLILFLLFLAATYFTLSVFLGIFTFAIIFAVPFAPLFNKLVGWLGGKRKLAAIIYGVILVAVVAVPLLFVISSLASFAQQLQDLLHDIREHRIPALPAWLSDLPYVGEKATALWSALENDPEGTLKKYEPQLKVILPKIIQAGGSIITTGLELVVGVIISAILLLRGEKAVEPLRQFLEKILGKDMGTAMLSATGRAINGVAVGVMGTALIAMAVSWIGFKIAGIAIAGGLAAVIFLFTVVQLGPVPVMLPVVLWMFSQDHTGWGIFMIVWTLVLMVVDNVIKPILIGKSGKLPILVLFLGVIGGMSAWGFTGMFKGAIVLAVSYTLFTSWAKRKGSAADPS